MHSLLVGTIQGGGYLLALGSFKLLCHTPLRSLTDIAYVGTSHRHITSAVKPLQKTALAFRGQYLPRYIFARVRGRTEQHKHLPTATRLPVQL